VTLLYAGSALTEAWQLSEAFWTQTLRAFAHHPAIILLYAAPVAIERAWAALRSRPIPTAWLPSVEALVFLWRLLMCAVAVWVVITPTQQISLRTILKSNTSIQGTLELLGAKLGQQLWLLLWEIVFCLAGFLLLNWLVTAIARLLLRGLNVEREQKKHQRVALSAVARNLVLVPLALIYVAVVVRSVLTHT
jgi:hypothetical protein